MNSWTKRASMLSLAVVAAVSLTAPMSVAAKAGDVIRTGSCSGSADWKLKLSPEDGRIEVQFEVETSRAGRAWSVKMWQNGNVFFTGTRTTQADGDFQVRFLRTNNAGTDTFKGQAVNLSSGQTCTGTASF
jgi:hypothetical protein